MIRLGELVRIPNPYPVAAVPPIDPRLLDVFRRRAGFLLKLCLQNGVMNADEAHDFVKHVEGVIAAIDDLQYRLTLREGFDSGDLYDLRTKWKEEYRRFFKFRDAVRDTLNLLVQNRVIALNVSDAVKLETDHFCQQMAEFDKSVQTVLRRG
jgi:hypothetical protein